MVGVGDPSGFVGVLGVPALQGGKKSLGENRLLGYGASSAWCDSVV